MDGEQVIGKILSDAKAEAEKIITKADEQIATEAEKLDKQLKDYKKQTDSIAKSAAEEKEARMLAEARMQIAKQMLAEKRKILDDIFEDAKKQLKKLPDEEYKNLMTKLMLKAVQTGNEEVIIGKNETRIDQNLIKQVNDKLQEKNNKKAELKLSVKKQDIAGGFILKREKIKTNLSVNILLKEARRKLEIELAKDLFT